MIRPMSGAKLSRQSSSYTDCFDISSNKEILMSQLKKIPLENEYNLINMKKITKTTNNNEKPLMMTNMKDYIKTLIFSENYLMISKHQVFQEVYSHSLLS